jgi:hypothetical protein
MVVAVLLVVLVAGFELARRLGPEEQPTPQPPPPTATPSVAPAATATATPTPTPATLISDWVEAAPPEPTATPTVSFEPLPRRPSPTPPTECVETSWSAYQSLATIANALVDIQVINHCPRDLEPTEVSFVITGFRDGGVVQTARGNLFQRLRRNNAGQVIIGLPGSVDWYDAIEVVTITPYGSSTSVGRGGRRR